MDISSITSGYNSDILDTYKSKVETDNYKKTIAQAQENGDDEQLKEACVEFESYFLKMMLSSMRDTINTEDSFIPQSNGEKIFQDMLDDEYAKKAAEGGNGIGLAKALYKQLSARSNKANIIEP